MFSVGVTASERQLRVQMTNPSWNIPDDAFINATVQIDGGWVWRTDHASQVVGVHNTVGLFVQPSGYRQFVHEMTSGRSVTVRFTGNEAPWTFSLAGTTGVWPAFMDCVTRYAPNVIAALNPTQPYTSTQPYSHTPPSQPWVPVPTQPYSSTQPKHRHHPVASSGWQSL